ncbi:MAG: hypothetical protein IJ087_19660 [Eggerthellaceae bacterium]|nr:hypothetical protein [Eggerthellaceae bacterium]
MRRFLAGLLSAVLVVGLMPVPAFAEHEAVGATGLVAALADGGMATQDAESGSGSTFGPISDDKGRQDQSLSPDFKAQSIGVGGHGASFDPVISPHDPKTFVVDCDMGGLYVTHDEGANWDIKNCGGRVWDIKANPHVAGTFYAGGSGLWRSTDYGNTWKLLWPDPETVYATPTKLKNTRTFYYSTDTYPDEDQVEAIAVDPADGSHIVVLTTDSPNYTSYGGKPLARNVYESANGGASFELVASFDPVLEFVDRTVAVNNHVFIEPAAGASASASRIVVSDPDGVFAVNRSTQEAALLYAPASGERLIDCAQVRDDDGMHYVVLETANSEGDAALEKHTRIRLWHTTDFGNAEAAVDLTDEMVASLPRVYYPDMELVNGQRVLKGDEYEITAHNAIGICAPAMDRIYLAYRTRDATDPNIPSYQGINGLVTYDATKPEGSRFAWTYGLRRWWKDPTIRTTPDQNMLMERGHCDAMFTMLGMAADPNDSKRLVLTTHSTLLFSPDIDYEKLYQAASNRYYVNLYPRYARWVEANPDYENDPGMARTRSTGLEVTVSFCMASDPFDPKHLTLGMDDAGLAHSYDGGETWYSFYRNRPQGTVDTVGDLVFDEGRKGVAYASWHASGLFMHAPETRFLRDRGQITRSTDGGRTWQSFSTGLPETAAITDIEVVYPRDAAGNITDGERTIYVATMGYGFYVSYDSGVTFKEMNAGIPTVETNGVDCVWSRHIQATGDGRIFGTTQYSSLGPANKNGSTTYHSTQDARTFGNVWEWDASANGGAGMWVRLPLNMEGGVYDDETRAYSGGVQLRQPSGMCYDEYTRTLYVTGQCCLGPSYGGVMTNFGGGLYAYTSAAGAGVGSGAVKAVDAASPLLGNERNLVSVGRDSFGRMWLAAEDGDVYVNSGQDMSTGWSQVLDDAFRMCDKLCFGRDGNVYLTTSGIGSLRIEPTGAVNLASAVVSLSRASYTYDGMAHEPGVSVRFGSRELVWGSDYAVSYSNNVEAGTASVTVKGIGAYGGELVRTFAIEGAPPVEGGSPGAEGSDEDPAPSDGVTPGVDQPTSEPSGETETETETKTETENTSLAQAAVSGVVHKTYTGKWLTQSPVVRLGSRVLTEGEDYAVSYLSADRGVVRTKGVISAGSYYVRVTGRGSYVGSSAAVRFEVAKAKQAISARHKVVKSYAGKKVGRKRLLGATKSFSLRELACISAKTPVKFKKSNAAGGNNIRVHEDIGRVTVLRGLARGTYNVKVKLSAAEGANYRPAASKMVNVKVRVK